MNVLPIVLVLASLAVFILEVLVLSFGILTLVGVSLGVGGILLAFQESGLYGWTMVGVLVGGVPTVVWLAFRILPKLPFARGLYLRAPELTEQDRRAAATSFEDLRSAVGVATSPLRPSGSAEFDGRPVHVVTTGGMIARGERVRVVRVTGNRIVVEPAGKAGD